MSISNDIYRVLEALDIQVGMAGADYIYQRRHKETMEKVPLGGTQGGCFYVFNGGPDCLVGRVLVSLGVPVKTLALQEGRPAASLRDTGLRREALNVLYAAQRVQDQGGTWGSAVNQAHRVANGYLLELLAKVEKAVTEPL